MHSQSLDLKQAKTSPSRVFAEPADVLTHPDLSRETKIEILRQWEIDARLLSEAENENMAGGESSHLGKVVSALLALEDEGHMPS
jgi:hypothetical protein